MRYPIHRNAWQLVAFLISFCTISLYAQLPFQPAAPAPPNFQQSPLGLPHYGPARQASTPTSGPVSNNVDVQIRNFQETLGKDVGTSPWHMVSPQRYSNSTAVTIWGATLTDAYRFLVDGERFEALDRFPINYFPSSIPWNLFSMDDGRVVVPDASGYRIAGKGKRSNNPSWLILKDGNGNPARSKIRLTDLLEFKEQELRQLVQPPAGSKFANLTAANGSVPTYSGEIATTISFLDKQDVRYTYLLIVDVDQKTILAGGLIGQGLKTNEIAAEPFGTDGTAFYVPLDESIIKMVYNSSNQQLERHWEARLPVRRRTGSTPTLVNTSDGRQFVCVIDSECAVTSITNGLIACSEDSRPSQLVAVERSAAKGATPRILTTTLPTWLRTVENSPAALGDQIVVANYSGYLPNGLLVPAGGALPANNTARWLVSPDAQADFATGIVALRYDKTQQNFVLDWQDPKRQVSCIPTISAGANRIYGVGAEQTNGDYWLYGYQLTDEPNGGGKGDLKLRIRLGKAPFRATQRDRQGNLIIPREDYQLKAGEIFDAGNQIILLEDGSLIISGGSALVRVRERR